jgi:hypothetical protein
MEPNLPPVRHKGIGAHREFELGGRNEKENFGGHGNGIPC